MSDPLVSVGICTFNQKTLCTELVRGLLEHGPGSIKIMIWDNNPNPPITEFHGELVEDPRIEVFLDETNPGYIIPNNRMASATKSEYHIVANDDVKVGPGWFEKSVQYFHADPLLACLGPRGLFHYLDEDFSGQQQGVAKSEEYVEGWWMMFPRHIIDRYAVFDEQNLRIATSEDSHASLLLREYGWRIKVVDDLPIQHLESRTKKALNMEDWGAENKTWLRQRWRAYLRNPRRDFPNHTILVRSNSVNKKKLEELRWRFPHSHITFLIEPGLVDVISNAANDQNFALTV